MKDNGSKTVPGQPGSQPQSKPVEGSEVASVEKTDSIETTEPETIEAPPSIVANSLLDFSEYANPEKEDMLGDGEARQTLRELQDQKLITDEELAVAEEELAGTKRLESKGYVTRNALDKKEISVKQSRLKVQSASTKLNLFIKYELPKAAEQALSKYEEGLQELSRTVSMSIARMAQAEAKVNSARNRFNLESTELKELREQLENCNIQANTAGMVVYAQGDRWRDDEQIRVGATVRQRQEILTIPDMTQMSVQVKIPESYVKKVEKGQPAKVRLEAEPGRVLDGTITKVSVLPDSGDRWRSPDRKVYSTQVTIQGAHTWLKPGMTAEVEVIVDQLEDVVYVPFQAVNTVDEYHIVFADDASGNIKLKEVKIGQFNDEFIEILEGIEEGTVVHLKTPKDGPQQIKDFLKRKTLNQGGPETTAVPAKELKTKV
jgi:RND family efflux transporter MFP subunit